MGGVIMEIHDKRSETKELTFSGLEVGKVYINTRFQKYFMMTKDHYTVCLETGELFDADGHRGDVFTEVNARLEIY